MKRRYLYISCLLKKSAAVEHIAKPAGPSLRKLVRAAKLDTAIERDISKAKCKIKLCCIKNEHDSCADCLEYPLCSLIQDFHNKKGYKYSKYKQAIEFIRNNGYSQFIEIADKWKNAYGKYV